MTLETNLINIVLVDTIHPGNIGSVARAMKTMGLQRLSLVKPRVFPSGESTALAGNATDVLENAIIFDSLKDDYIINYAEVDFNAEQYIYSFLHKN